MDGLEREAVTLTVEEAHCIIGRDKIQQGIGLLRYQ